MSKNIFIFEPYVTGHHTGFLRLLLEMFRKHDGWRTALLTSREAADHPALKQLTEELGDRLEVIVARDPKASWLTTRLLGRFYAEQFANFAALQREFRALHDERRFDFALLPYLEAVGIHNLAFRRVFGSVPWAVIPHGLRFHFRESGIKSSPRWIDGAQRVCFRKMLRIRALAGVFSLDPYLVKWANHPKVVFIRDPAKLPLPLDPKACRRTLELPDDAIVVLVYGAIDQRKCLDLLLPAAAQIEQGHRVCIVIAGIQDPRVREGVLSGSAAAKLRLSSRLIEFDRFMSSEEEQMLFHGADIVWAYYRDQLGSSGVLVRAGQYSKPVIANDVGLAGRLVTDQRCGFVVSRFDPAEVTKVIIELAKSPAIRDDMGQRAFAYFSQNVPEAFAGPVGAAIERACPAA